jgi:hypothetical protein
MTHSVRLSRVALLFLALGTIFWLGGVNVRALIGNVLLKPGTLTFEEYLAPEAEGEIFRMLAFTSVLTMISYGVVLVSGTIFLLTTTTRLRENGWLMMSAILFYTFVPVELYTGYLDGRMIYFEFFTTAGNDVFRAIFLTRLQALAGAPFVALLCYYTIIGLVIFRPLTRPLPQST